MDLKEVTKEVRAAIRKHGGSVPRFTKGETSTGAKLWIDESGKYWWSQSKHPQGETFSFSLFRQPENKRFEMVDAAKDIFMEP